MIPNTLTFNITCTGDENRGFKTDVREAVLMEDGSTYVGEWHAGKQICQGFGVLVRPDRTVYQGNWQTDKFHGCGWVLNPSQQVFI